MEERVVEILEEMNDSLSKISRHMKEIEETLYAIYEKMDIYNNGGK